MAMTRQMPGESMLTGADDAWYAIAPLDDDAPYSAVVVVF
jgi:hypothetical protein